MKRFLFILVISIFFILYFIPANANTTFSTAEKFSYTVQKYSGLNYVVDFLAEAIIKFIIKLKTKAKDISVDLKIYSAWDLFRKKAKSLEIETDKLFVEGIPIEHFKLVTSVPIYFKKKQVVFPLDLYIDINVNLEQVTEVLNNLPKWEKVLKELELPIPPFGVTEVAINDLKIIVSETGFVEAGAVVTSLINPESEPLELMFTGNLVLVDKKIVIYNLQAEIVDIFTKDSEMGVSFSKFLEDLINPVLDFHKYERNGLTIDSVNLSFGADNLSLNMKCRLLPADS